MLTAEARACALALSTTIRETQDPDALWVLATQDLITLQAETRLPWSVCSKLTQYARCRWWAAHWLAQRRGKALRREQALVAFHARYFAALQRRRTPATTGATRCNLA